MVGSDDKRQPPDALRLSGLRSSCNILNFHAFVGRIRRSRRIRHEQIALCQQFGPCKYNHSIKPAKNYRFINKYILTPDLFSPIDNHHYVFYFSPPNRLRTVLLCGIF
ncbi:hypothetical protein OIU82_19315 [Escherichia coli]|nr:hypothetical protein [Escherichia coli]